MKKLMLWPTKSMGNFALTCLGVTAIGFWSYSIYSERKFNQPIIAETVKIMGKHRQIKELIGNYE